MANYRFSGVSIVQIGDNLLTDLTNTLNINWTEGNTYFVNYVIKDGDTQENIAYRLWGDSSLSWIINYINGIIDPFFDWPLRPTELTEYIKNRYGENKLLAIHHYERNGYIVNNGPDAKPVSNYEYEFRRNEAKRNIIVPTESFVRDFLAKWSEQ